MHATEVEISDNFLLSKRPLQILSLKSTDTHNYSAKKDTLKIVFWMFFFSNSLKKLFRKSQKSQFSKLTDVWKTMFLSAVSRLQINSSNSTRLQSKKRVTASTFSSNFTNKTYDKIGWKTLVYSTYTMRRKNPTRVFTSLKIYFHIKRHSMKTVEDYFVQSYV